MAKVLVRKEKCWVEPELVATELVAVAMAVTTESSIGLDVAKTLVATCHYRFARGQIVDPRRPQISRCRQQSCHACQIEGNVSHQM